MRTPRALLCLPLLLLCAATVAAQEPPPSRQPPPLPSPTPEEFQTRLETMMTEVGSVIIKGFTNVGSMNGSRGVAYFTAWEVTDARTGRREQGVGVEISDTTPSRRDPFEERAYIDYDELEPLLKGIDYMMKLDDKVTKLARYEAQYQTRGGLVLVSFNTPSGYTTAISTGGARGSRFVLRPTGLAEFRNLLESARDALDAPRAK